MFCIRQELPCLFFAVTDCSKAELSGDFRYPEDTFLITGTTANGRSPYIHIFFRQSRYVAFSVHGAKVRRRS